MATTYCNTTTDLARAYSRIEEFKEQRTFRGWVLHSGSVYKIGNTGYVSQLFENNLQLTAAATLGTIAAGKFYYDSDVDVLYVQATSGLPTDSTNIYRGGEDWDGLKTWAVAQASGIIEGALDPQFPRPLPESPLATSTTKYDAPLILATAYIAAALIVGRREPPAFNADGSAANVSAQLRAAGELIITRYNKREYLFSWEVSEDEVGGVEVTPSSTNTSQGILQVRGQYTGSEDAYWIVKISTGGDLGTAQYQLSTDNGANYATAITTVATNLWVSLANGIEVRFLGRGGAASNFIVNDTWQIVVTSSDRSQSRPRMGSVSLIG